MSIGKIRDSKLRDMAVYCLEKKADVLVSVHSEAAAKQVMSIIKDRNANYTEFARLLSCEVNGAELSKIVTIGGVYHVDPNREVKLQPLPGPEEERGIEEDIRCITRDMVKD